MSRDITFALSRFSLPERSKRPTGRLDRLLPGFVTDLLEFVFDQTRRRNGSLGEAISSKSRENYLKATTFGPILFPEEPKDVDS